MNYNKHFKKITQSTHMQEKFSFKMEFMELPFFYILCNFCTFSVMQSDGNNIRGDVVSDSFTMVYSDEDSI